MSMDREFERVTEEWLDAGSDVTRAEVIDAVLLAARNMPQERGYRVPWRTLTMKNPLYAAAAVAVVVVAGAATLYAIGPGLNIGSDATPSPTIEQTQAPTATATPIGRIDTRNWTTYESERYGWTIGHPADWTVIPAEHDWTLGRDAQDVMSSGQEMFMAPSGNVRVSAWSVPDESPETRAHIEAWIERYCERASGAGCSADLDRAVPLCLEKRDCHPGLLVQFPFEVQAFFGQGIYQGQMVVVTVWWGEDEPAVAPYGGSQRLLEAFIATMQVWPESVPVEYRNNCGQVVVCPS